MTLKEKPAWELVLKGEADDLKPHLPPMLSALLDQFSRQLLAHCETLALRLTGQLQDMKLEAGGSPQRLVELVKEGPGAIPKCFQTRVLGAHHKGVPMDGKYVAEMILEVCRRGNRPAFDEMRRAVGLDWLRDFVKDSHMLATAQD